MTSVDDNHEDSGGDAGDLQELTRRLQNWQPDQTGTLMFLHDGDRVLLIRKRRGHGAGKINGPGGKPEAGETPLQCVLRETVEEVGVEPRAPWLAGVFRFLDTRGADWLGYIYLATQWSGEPRTTAEAIPGWYARHALPYEEMWDDDRLWLPRLLAGERLAGDFLFTDGRLLAHRLRRLDAGDAL